MERVEAFEQWCVFTRMRAGRRADGPSISPARVTIVSRAGTWASLSPLVILGHDRFGSERDRDDVRLFVTFSLAEPQRSRVD